MMSEKVLVTGATGFIGMRIISELLNKGYEVRTTVRQLNKKDNVLKTLKANNIPTDQLTFVEADLSKNEHWDDAMEGCKYVFSVASPVFFDIPKDDKEVIRPAIEGIQRILRAAEKSNVQRVIMTANFGAIGFSNKNKSTVTDESYWTNENEKGLSAYEKSKLLAEKAAWQFVNHDDNHLELVTINPVAIMGPSMDSHVSGSFGLIKNLLNGSMKRVPNIPLNIVDVRDVVDLHIRAMEIEMASGKRFIATADGQISLPEIAELIKKERPNIAQKVSTKRLPNFVLSIGSKFNAQAQEGKLLHDINRNVSNRNARDILGWQPIATQEEAVLAAVDSIDKYHLV